MNLKKILSNKFNIAKNENIENRLNKQKSNRVKLGESNKPTFLILDMGIKVKNLSKTEKMAAEDELRYEALRFAHSTTAHGIPMVSLIFRTIFKAYF